MSLQISHERMGRIMLRRLAEDDHPKTSLSLQGVHEADVFLGAIRVLEYSSFDGPVHFYNYTLRPAVTLRKQHAAKSMKLMAMVEGTMVLQLSETEKWKLTEGKLFLLHSDDYSLVLPADCKVRYLLVHIEQLVDRMGWEVFPEGRYELGAGMQVCLSAMLQPPEFLASPQDWLSIQLINLLYQLREILVSGGQRVNDRDHLDYVLAADTVIRQNLLTDLTTDQIAKSVGLYETALKGAFKKYFNMGMAGWQNQLRVERAMQLLRNTDRSIREIYLACGYVNETTFRHNFKTVTRLNPAAWRKKYKA